MVVIALAITGGLIVGMKAGVIGGGSLNLSAGDPSGSPAPAPAKSKAPPRAEAASPQAALSPNNFVDIRRVKTTVRTPEGGPDASRGTFVSRCGTNQNDHNNTDDFILAPGVTNGAHFLQDYTGNLSTNASSTDRSLAAADTTCRLGDKSTYYWPVLRVPGAAKAGGATEGNVGQVLRPASATLLFRGNPRGDVVAMPRFLRIITGDAKAVTQADANAKAAWSCTGFTDRVTGKYPLCPSGSQVMRTLIFPSCWDGRNTDSADHRTHVVFPDAATGACPAGRKAVPQLQIRLTYSVPRGPSFAIDSLPEPRHSPLTDHAGFENLMPTQLMKSVVSCINRNQNC
ncbi:MAG TPA: DUF1996 domain-containing protein [Streptosporangiaceae bacterium]